MKKITYLLLVAALSVTSASTIGYGQSHSGPAQAFWTDPDTRFEATEKPFTNPVWKGEKVNASAVFRNNSEDGELCVTAGPLKHTAAGSLPCSLENCVNVGLIFDVTGDELLEQYNQCGARDTVNYKAVRVADRIGHCSSAVIGPGETRPVWLSIKVPSDAAPGKYSGVLTFSKNGAKLAELPYSIKVVDKVLPPLSESPFHLDLWQNPYAVARFHNVPLWSREHFEYLRPVMKMLADAGQKVVTATIMNRPWAGQTEDPFGPMVTKIRRADGSWMYDYTVFDMWVKFMFSLGIDSQINCYTLIPWALTFDYFDQASNRNGQVHAVPGSPEYEEYWGTFIKDFAAHLKANGWFEKTHIAMDERPEESMKAALALIKKIEPGFKVALAGNYHESIADDIDDLCIALGAHYPEGIIEKRRAAGKSSIYYTCCAEKYPNTFIASIPSEASWLPWLALSRGEDGYLRWAFNSWTADPLRDARFRSWAAGDCYMVYPNGESSVRFEKLVEGLQDYLKATILLSEWENSGKAADRKKAAGLRKALERFSVEELGKNGPAPALQEARKILNGKY